MTTLASAILDLARLIGSVTEGTATGGSTTTLADTLRTEPDDHFKNGTIFFLSTVGLIGKSAVITNWTGTTFTFPTQTASPVAGTQYAACNNDYPRWLLIQAVNNALKELVPAAYNTALVTVDLQEEYTLPAGVYNVKRVEIASVTATPFDYAIHYHWNEIGGKIKFDEGTEPEGNGFTIRLTYVPAHTEIYTDTAAIDNGVNPEHLKWKAAVYALRWRVNLTHEDEPERLRQLNEALVTVDQKAGMYPMPNQERDPHLAAWGTVGANYGYF